MAVDTGKPGLKTPLGDGPEMSAQITGGEKKKNSRKGRILLVLGISMLFLAVAGIVYEMRTFRLQARYLAGLASQCSFHLEPGPSNAIRFPAAGPYDERLGYVRLPDFIERLIAAGYVVAAQARSSPTLLEVADRGFFPAYREKTNAGLHIADRLGEQLFSFSYPERFFPDFDSIPDLVVGVLLFIENRELLDPRFPHRNPSVEWDRLGVAVFDLGLRLIDKERSVPGGSTLATQIEKYRHSLQGQTFSLQDKFRQMVSASLRAYLDGEDTSQARKQIVLDFINSMPLGAAPGYGEISGLGDGLFAWYGTDLAAAAGDLAVRPSAPDDPHLRQWSSTLKQLLSLFVAQRRPSFYLLAERQALEAKTDSYLRVLAEAGIIRPWERDAAIGHRLSWQRQPAVRERISFVERKAVNAVRTGLLSLLGVRQFYELNQLDLAVRSTLDRQVQQEVTAFLRSLHDPALAAEAGLGGSRLLEQSDPARVIYSFTLYERSGSVNLLRIQADNFNQPLDINAGIKLELGSSAKLRTLTTYLEIIQALHDRYAELTETQLREQQVHPTDFLSRWAIDYLDAAADRQLSVMLAAAMERRYSASPAERFFTGGGDHTFVNFDRDHDRGVYTVKEAFRHSINLVFIRMMRDIVRYYMFQIPGVAELMADPQDPRRQDYLARFADQEGSLFLQRFYRKYRDRSFDESLAMLLQGIRATPRRLAAVYRYLKPGAEAGEFAAFLREHFPDADLSESTVRRLYRENSPEAWSLLDRGYIARVHPLELWTVAYLADHPDAGRDEVMKASVAERQEVYTWLFKTARKNRQDSRIRSILEMEAFHEIHAGWRRLRYPFASLVPSYATAIGSSADRPAALAELVGIIQNGGEWHPAMRIEELHFAQGTPYETRMAYRSGKGEQVLHPEVASVLRTALIDVVTDGTGQRVRNAFLRADGSAVAVGGKTGTGDNRREIYGPGGRLISSKAINRTAVLVFLLGDRFFGTITAYVPEPDAEDYRFTSALPTQVLRVLAPKLMPLLSGDGHPEAVSGAAFQH